MKNLLLTFSITLSIATAFAQAPDKINYQGVARNAAGNVLANQNISLKLSIIHGAPTGSVQYSERHLVITNTYGLFTVKIGEPTSVLSGSFAAVSWESSDKYIKVEMDPAAGTNYTDMGTTQLVSVPYALVSGRSTDNKWLQSGNNIINTNNGNVGIGTLSPESKLHIQNGGFTIGNTTDAKRYELNYDATDNYFYIDEYGTSRHFLIKNGGAIGMGTSSIAPESRLAIGALNTTDEGGQIQLNAPSVSYSRAYFIDNYQNQFRILSGTNTGSTNERLSINNNGDVNINAGELNRTSTGSANMAPVAYGVVGCDGSVISGTGNFTVAVYSGTLDTYTITFNDFAYSNNCIASVTPVFSSQLGNNSPNLCDNVYGSSQSYMRGSSVSVSEDNVYSGSMQVIVWSPEANGYFQSHRQPFSFIVYKP